MDEIKTLKLDHCWICKRKLGDSGGDPSMVRNEHHVIPRAFGGADGPTVSLCSAHHDLMHKIGDRLIAGKPHFELLTKDPEIDYRMLWLASRVQASHSMFSDDPNKKQLLIVRTNATISSMVSDLKKALKLSNREEVILHLIKSKHSQLFPRIKSNVLRKR
jgi:hypothetical protein